MAYCKCSFLSYESKTSKWGPPLHRVGAQAHVITEAHMIHIVKYSAVSHIKRNLV